MGKLWYCQSMGIYETGLELIREAARKAGLTNQFFDQLERDSDWALVIKCHAMLETAVKIQIKDEFYRTNHKRVDKYVDNLPLCGRTGALELAKSLNLVDDSSYRFIEALSSVRNRFVHRVSNFDSSIESISEKRDLKLLRDTCGKDEAASLHVRDIIIQGSISAFIELAAPIMRVAVVDALKSMESKC